MKGFYPLIIAQFLSAFADNATLFAVISIVLHDQSLPNWYVSALQSAFLVAFVILAPWVGPYADRQPKPRVLLLANCIKAAGALLILGGIEPLIAYAVIGVGAAVYAPAKYGILPEMVEHSDLVKANSWIEGSTILAILLGTIAGAEVADRSISAAMLGIFMIYLLSAAVTLLLPRLAPSQHQPGNPLKLFVSTTGSFLSNPRARFVIFGSSLFWSAAAALRVILVAWAPLVLLLPHAADVAALTLFLAIGIVIGASVAPRLIPLEHLRRTRLAAYAMAAFILVLAMLDQLWSVRSVLLLIGMAGGIFVVPINAALQEIGHKSVGSGGAVAVQGFMENLAMLLAVGAYSFGSAQGMTPHAALLGLGGGVFLLTLIVSRYLPQNAP